ncbi:CsiV family protein [Endozoicomonas sp. ALC020]|uniref:CsiV family protein n=1 Tax=unclassified Endozoicomonas TaxID=2644528 RepID=UPI003BB08C94
MIDWPHIPRQWQTAAHQTEGLRVSGLSRDFMKQKAIGTLLLSTISMTAIASEDTQWYQADMIVFLNEQSASDNEKWPDITAHPLPADTIKLKSYNSGTDAKGTSSDLTDFLDRPDKKPATDLERDAFVSLPYPSHLLQSESSALSKNGGYRILDQKAWLMPLREGKSSRPIRIGNYNTQSKKPSMLEGTVTISSSRYLHVKVNLWYSELAWEALAKNMENVQPHPESQKKPTLDKNLQLVRAPDGQPMKISRNFHLQESRRIKNSDEVQYLDSPVIGVLFKLTPYKKPDKPLLPEMEADQEKSPEPGILPGIVDQEGS